MDKIRLPIRGLKGAEGETLETSAAAFRSLPALADLTQYQVKRVPGFLRRLDVEAVLLGYQGPLVAAMLDPEEQRHYLMQWVVMDRVYNRWLVLEISADETQRLIDSSEKGQENEEEDQLPEELAKRWQAAAQEDKCVWIVDKKDPATTDRVFKLTVSDVPKDYYKLDVTDR